MHKLFKIIVMVGFVSPLLLLAGCRTAGLQAGDAGYASSPYVVLDDPSLANQISIVNVAHDKVGKLMRAHVTLKSNRARSLRLRYRFSWYDTNGMEIDGTGQPYRDLIIQGRDAVSVTSVAPSPYAEEFKISVRKVRALRIENIR